MKLRSPFKIVLAIFSVYMVIHAQNTAFAQGGVPWGRLIGQTESSLVGTYAGVMLPEGADPEAPDDSFIEADVLGLFATSVGATGLSSGINIIFVNGVAAFGTMIALGDPAKGTISAVLQASRTTTERIGNVVFLIILADAGGRFTANLVRTDEQQTFFVFPRLEGRGALAVRTTATPTESVRIIVDGYRQTTAVGQLGEVGDFGSDL